MGYNITEKSVDRFPQTKPSKAPGGVTGTNEDGPNMVKAMRSDKPRPNPGVSTDGLGTRPS